MAILGSLSAPVYAAGVRPAAALLPGDAGKAVTDSLAGAGAVAGYLHGPQGEALLQLARSSFVDGMDVAVLVGAIVALVGAAVALAFLPGRSATATQATASEKASGPGVAVSLAEAA